MLFTYKSDLIFYKAGIIFQMKNLKLKEFT